jgi:oligopeptide/dipeptide ABC transporter ATP-binding protein
MTAPEPLLSVSGLTTAIPTPRGPLFAARDISFTLARGKVLGLVGESGSGKTTTGLSVLRLLRPPARVAAGAIRFKGQDLLGLAPEAMRRLRGNRMAMIFQNPLSSFNPTESIGAQIAETLQTHQELSAAERRERVEELLNLVGIPSPRERMRSYPHEFSGGMRQRAMIAMALANNPDLLVADEPTTALDVTIQAQILWLLGDLQNRLGMAMIYITHDLHVAANVCDEIAVMYGGMIVEQGPTAELFRNPTHPYTRGLIEAIPSGHWRKQRVQAIPGQPPELTAGMAGCPFADRCPLVTAECREAVPPMVQMAAARETRCWHAAG